MCYHCSASDAKVEGLNPTTSQARIFFSLHYFGVFLDEICKREHTRHFSSVEVCITPLLRLLHISFFGGGGGGVVEVIGLL